MEGAAVLGVLFMLPMILGTLIGRAIGWLVKLPFRAVRGLFRYMLSSRRDRESETIEAPERGR